MDKAITAWKSQLGQFLPGICRFIWSILWPIKRHILATFNLGVIVYFRYILWPLIDPILITFGEMI